MATGLQVLNADGSQYQIDGEYKNMRLVGHFTAVSAAFPPNLDNFPLPFGSFNVRAHQPILAYRCVSPCSLQCTGANGDDYNFVFYTADPSTTIEVFVYSTTTVGINAGIEVYSSIGELVFTSEDKSAKVIGLENPPQQASSPIYTYPVSKIAVVAASVSFRSYRTSWAGNANYRGFSTYFVQTPSQSRFQTTFREYYRYIGNYPPDQQAIYPTFLVLDVSDV